LVAIHENDLAALLNSFHEGICCLTAQGEVQCFNETAQAHWNGEEFIKDALPSLPAVARALAGEEIIHELIRVNEQRVLLINVKPLYEGTNTVTRVVVISFDASESVHRTRQAEAALQVLIEAAVSTTSIAQIEEALRRVTALLPQLESVDHGIAFRIEGTTLIPVAIFGIGEQKYTEWHSELTVARLNTEDALKRPGSAYLHALQLAQPVMIDFTDNSEHYVNSHNLQAAIYAPVMMDGKIVGLLGVERERPRDEMGTFFPLWSIQLLTALARLTSMTLEKTLLLSTLTQAQGEADAAQKLLYQKEEFLSLAAHELKNPLTAIRGQSQVLRRRINRSLHSNMEPTEEEMNDLLKSLGSIERQTHRIEQMINTLLMASRVDLDRLELNLQPLDLVQLTKRTLESFIPQANTTQIRFRVEGKPVQLEIDKQANTPAISILGDESRIEQMLANLLSNAIRYSPQGGPITVAIQRLADNFVDLSVQDVGIGIPPEAQAHLTERFYRAENARRVSGQGLGLGLFLVNELARRHGGHLSLESKGIPGEGSTFHITLVGWQ
jgi:signal transduction histidine kinase